MPHRQPLELAAGLILVTNAPEESCPPRWSVTFTECAGRWNLFPPPQDGVAPGQERKRQPHRVQCEIWARLYLPSRFFSARAAKRTCWFETTQRSEFENSGACSAMAHTPGSGSAGKPRRILDQFRRLWRNYSGNARKGRQKTRTNTGLPLRELQPSPMADGLKSGHRASRQILTTLN